MEKQFTNMRFFLVLIFLFFIAKKGATQTQRFGQGGSPIAFICGADIGTCIVGRAAQDVTQGVTGSISSKSVNLKLPATDVILITRTNSANNIN
jgi:hypothetical protein